MSSVPRALGASVSVPHASLRALATVAVLLTWAVRHPGAAAWAHRLKLVSRFT